MSNFIFMLCWLITMSFVFPEAQMDFWPTGACIFLALALSVTFDAKKFTKK